MSIIPSEQGNRAQWTGQGFEIWFFVILIPDQPRALWVRLTRYRDGDAPGDSRVWAVVSEDGGVHAQRELHPLEAMQTQGAEGQFHVRVADCEFGHGRSAGECGDIRWSFEYDASDPLIVRLPQLPSFVPLGTHSLHPHAEAEVRGWVEVGGRRMSLDGGLLTQMHIWGSKRVEWLRWAWVPAFEADAELELTAVAPEHGGAGLCALWVRVGERRFDLSGLLRAARAKLLCPRPGVMQQHSSVDGLRLVVRVWGREPSFAGWDYRQLGGGMLPVAQSNQGECELEIYRRAGLGWTPQQRLRSRCAALEFHGLEDYPCFDYVAWDAEDMRPRPRSASAPSVDPHPPGPGRWIDTPAPARVVALGLNYRSHARETSSALESVVFEKDASAWAAVREPDSPVLRPSSARLRELIAAKDPELAGQLEDFGFMPAMLDYEVELGLLLLDGLAPGAVPEPGRVALLLCNDLSARSLQVLGEGTAERLEWWRAAKSLPGFCAGAARAWVPARLDLDAWPELQLETYVNGEPRQSARPSAIVDTPRELLARALTFTGPLPPNTLVLTGTPSGVALQVPAWKRALGQRLLDRAGRLRAALAGFSADASFLRPGDRLELRAGFLGRFTQLVVAEDEPGSGRAS